MTTVPGRDRIDLNGTWDLAFDRDEGPTRRDWVTGAWPAGISTEAIVPSVWNAIAPDAPAIGYYRRFVEAMGDHPAAPGTGTKSVAAQREMSDRFYFAQCLKDETMAESIADAYAAGATGAKKPLVVHFNGAFHSDYGLGTAARVKRRLPNARLVVTTVKPVATLDNIVPSDDDRRVGDYVIYTTRTK